MHWTAHDTSLVIWALVGGAAAELGVGIHRVPRVEGTGEHVELGRHTGGGQAPGVLEALVPEHLELADADVRRRKTGQVDRAAGAAYGTSSAPIRSPRNARQPNMLAVRFHETASVYS
jgi:hypothetical protein